jgi:hypothetical protein
MIDIVTVVFDAEIPVLKLQAQSIDLYCRKIGVRNIYVVINDHDSVAEQIDPTWWGELADCVTILPRRIFSTEFVSNGWVSQQVLKILAASVSYNIWSMVLDAKTIFVRELKLQEIIDSNGQIQVGCMPIYPVFDASCKIVNQTYNIDLKTQLGPGGVPHFFHNSTVRHMIADTELIVKKSFPLWFQECGMLTEFILYAGYLQYKFGTKNLLYSSHNNIFPCNICHSEIDMFDQKLISAQARFTHTVSIHRNAWKQITLGQRQQYRDLLIQRGISKAETL